ncbi:glycosyltransferase [Vibrio rotiferianus]|uniref:glycosyltransferase n=1 Tax=Vibrio rotiferianus TaxID=190895 RepID=UPI0002377954|nr:glycosyltransferase [Vibrio rotiferianus]
MKKRVAPKQERRNVLHVVQHLAPGGLEMLVLEMLRFAPASDYVMIVSLEGTSADAINKWANLKPYQNRLIFLDKKPGFSPSCLHDLLKFIAGFKPGVVHTHHIGPLLYGGLAARITATPGLIHTEHDAWHLNNRKAARLQSRLLKLLRPQVVADADLVAKQIISKLDYHDVNTIHNGIDCHRFVAGHPLQSRKDLGLPTNKKIIGTAGRLELVKGHSILIRALHSLPENVHLAIAGMGSCLPTLRAQVETLGLSDRVSFLGLVQDMPTFYQSLDLFCLPSLQEGFPLSTLEAQACNVPCVASDVGAVSETLCPQSSVLVPPNAAEPLAKALQQQLSSVNSSPRHHIKRHFDIREMIKRYSNLTEGAQL